MAASRPRRARYGRGRRYGGAAYGGRSWHVSSPPVPRPAVDRHGHDRCARARTAAAPWRRWHYRCVGVPDMRRDIAPRHGPGAMMPLRYMGPDGPSRSGPRSRDGMLMRSWTALGRIIYRTAQCQSSGRRGRRGAAPSPTQIHAIALP